MLHGKRIVVKPLKKTDNGDDNGDPVEHNKPLH